jgi:putative transposase
MSQKTALLQTTDEFFHVYNRGVNQSTLFHRDEHYAIFLDRLGKCLANAEASLHAFSLMPNHFHFLLQQHQPYALARLLKAVCEPYAKMFNKTHHRTGHLFEERYKLRIVVERAYLLHLSRYIHLNPVFAGLAARPTEWKYSSASAYLENKGLPWLKKKVILSLAGGVDAYERYLSLDRFPGSEDMWPFWSEWEP